MEKVECVWASATQKIVDGRLVKLSPPECRKKQCDGFFIREQPKCDKFKEKVVR